MGKAGKQSPVLQSVLRRRVHDTYGGSTPPPIDELIESLRVKYPEYRRHNRQQFTRMVKQTLRNKRKLSTIDVDDDGDITSPSSSRRRIELQSDSSSSCEVNNNNSNNNNNNMQFDLTKSMLRDSYIGSNEPKNVELELVEMKKKVDNDKANSLSNGKHNGPLFKDFGGIDDTLHNLNLDVIAPLFRPETQHGQNLRPITGILLHGPPGCGKTQLARAIANEAEVPLYMTSATQLVSGISGASEENIRELFSKAYRTAPSVVFIDEIDAIASKRENHQREMDTRIVTQLMTCMDSKNTEMPDGKPRYVLTIGATNRPDALDPSLRRPGRFDREIPLDVPDENTRLKILTVHTRDKKVAGDIDLVKIARSTSGYVGADLENLVNEAGNLARRRVYEKRLLTYTKQDKAWLKDPWTREESDNFIITMSDFEAASKLVQPSLKREGFNNIPDVKWEDIGGLDSLRNTFYYNIVSRIKFPYLCKTFGDGSKTGYLLYGPPGCGKTSIVKAVANEAGTSFIHIQGPELMNKFVGESELALRTIFSRARKCSPCILFIDEIDCWTKKRGKEGGSSVDDRLLTQLMLELDGGEQHKGVYVIAATNRPLAMDRAVLRAGRLGNHIYVPLPNQDQRLSILKALTRSMSLDTDVDLDAIAQSEACENLSGADFLQLIELAKTAAYEEYLKIFEAAALEGTDLGDMPCPIKAVHFEIALGMIKPSISEKEKRCFDRMSKRLKKR